MASFSLRLADGSHLDGKEYTELSPKFQLSTESVPLLVLVHGGSYDCDFFDLDDKHSVRQWASIGVPVVALNRPGYGSTTPLSVTARNGNVNETFIERHGRWLNDLALPSVWEHFSKSLHVSSLVLYGSSIGGAVATVSTGLCGRDRAPKYKQAGLVLSAMGATPNSAPLRSLYDGKKGSTEPIVVPKELQESLAAGKMAGLYNPDLLRQDKGKHVTSGAELHDINVEWPEYWRSYAETVRVQVLYTLGDTDELWHVSPAKVNEFVQAFPNSPWVESRLLINAPHVPEFSAQCSGFYLRVFGFALECAASFAIQEQEQQLN